MKRLLVLLICLFSGCVGIPENVKPVDHFNLEKYLGKWQVMHWAAGDPSSSAVESNTFCLFSYR